MRKNSERIFILRLDVYPSVCRVYARAFEWGSGVRSGRYLAFSSHSDQRNSKQTLHLLSLLDKFKVTSEHVLIIGHCPLM